MVSGLWAAGQAAAFCDGELRVLPAVSGRTGGGNLRTYPEQSAEQPYGGQQHDIHRRDTYQSQRKQEEIPEGTSGESGAGICEASAGRSE